jgi:hypothetical protein
MNVYNRYDFNALPHSADITGAPINFYYQPLRTTGTVKLWPIPDNSTTTITFHYQSPFEDMDGASDDFDFPSEWIMALLYTLAWTMAPEFGIPLQERMALKAEAEFWHAYVLTGGAEEGSIFLQPDRTM